MTKITGVRRTISGHFGKEDEEDKKEGCLEVENSRDDIESIRARVNRLYDVDEAAKILGKVHPYFNRDATERVVRKLGNGEYIRWGVLAESITKMYGMMLIRSASTIKKLAKETGYEEDKIREFLHKNDIREFLHNVPDSSGEKYIRKADLPSLKSMLISRYGDNAIYGIKNENKEEEDRKREEIERQGEKDSLVDSLMRQCRGMGIAPRGDAMKLLQKAGVLDFATPERIRYSFEKYMEDMRGYNFKNFNEVRLRLDMDWDNLRKAVEPLMEKGYVKDLAASTDESSSFLVVNRKFQKQVNDYFDSMIAAKKAAKNNVLQSI